MKLWKGAGGSAATGARGIRWVFRQRRSLRTSAATYNAFISYSRALDEPIAIALQKGLHRLAKPWYILRRVRVFRDEASLSANPKLWQSIQDSLNSSEFFILLASPRAASSEWVGREVEYWLDSKPIDNLLIALTEGDLDWDAGAGSFRWPQTTALPRSLVERLRDEPRYVDLRWAREENLSLTHPRFRNAVADLAAPLHHRSKDDLIGEDIRQHKRTLRWRNSAIVSLVLLTVLAVASALLAVDQRNTARLERDTANSRSLAASSFDATQTQQLDLALLLAVESRRFSDTRESRDSLLNALLTEPELTKYLHGHSGTVAALGAADGNVTSMDVSGEVRRWNVDAGSSSAVSVAVEPGAGFAVSPDGRTFAYLRDGDIALRTVSSGQEFVLDEGGQEGVTEVVFSPNGSSLVSIRGNGFAVWELNTRRIIMERSVDVSNAAFDRDGTRLAVSASTGRVTVFELASGTERELEALAEFPARGLTFSPRGDSLFASTGDGAIIAWDLGTLRGIYVRPTDPTIGEFDGLLSDVYPLAVSADSEVLASGAPNGSITLWNLPQPGGSRVLGGGRGSPVTSLVFDGTGRLLSGSDSGSIAIRELAGAPPLAQPLRAPVSHVMTTAMSAHGSMAAAGGCASGFLQGGPEGSVECTKGAIAVWSSIGSPEARSTPRVLHGHHDFVTSIGFSNTGDSMLTSGYDGKVILWELSTGQGRVIHENERAAMIAIRPGTQSFALASFDGELSTMDLATKEKVVLQAKPEGQSNSLPGVTSVAFSPDGGLLVSGDHAGAVKLWDLDSKEPLVLARETGQSFSDVLGVAFSPDGGTLAAASRRGAISRWDARSGDLIGQPLVGRTVWGNLAFSPDGRILASVTGRGVVFWDTEDGLPLSQVLGNGNNSEGSITFSTGTKPVILFGGGDAVIMWDASVDSWVQRACARANRSLTTQEWDRFVGSGTAYRSSCPVTGERAPTEDDKPAGQDPTDRPFPPLLEGDITGTFSFAPVLDSCVGLADCRQLEDRLSRGTMDRVEDCRGRGTCRYVFNETGFSLPLSFDGVDWTGTASLPPEMAFTCNGRPRPTTINVALRVLSAHMANETWSATQVRIAMNYDAPEISLECGRASTQSSAIGSKR